ncbi:hypothetical protein [Actomonas aquatica]|uniref:Tetratricopeptide repeat protein n=1 Tax=Actomonas aquatica TaxID=2866162 RepID=A0ABZ1C6H7_9BACT|nr:hypothetical protein [Opitutus sp. WL0086]WRQ87199.1 hypothetical protein K1X11_020495 [Opitutus sp. WL0086]
MAGLSFGILFWWGAGCESTAGSLATNETSSDVTAIDGGDQSASETADVAAELTAAQQQAAEAERQLERDRQALQFSAWQHVKAIVEMWRQMPPEYFPGIATLVEQIDTLAAEIEREDSLQVGRIDPLQLTTHNPAFWRAMLETTPEDPVVGLFEQMLWTARGYFDRAGWLIDLQISGPALPMPVHRLTYRVDDEIEKLRARKDARLRALSQSLSGEELLRFITSARGFRGQDPDLVLASIVVRLRMAGIDPADTEATSVQVSELMETMRDDWLIVAEHNPWLAARFNPDPAARKAALEAEGFFAQLAESRGAYGERDLQRLAEAMAAGGFYAEAVQTSRRAVGMRGFTMPGDTMVWWDWLEPLIGAEETAALRDAMDSGEIRPVAFFEVGRALDGTPQLPLHPILGERALRRLQEVERRLSSAEPDSREAAIARLTQAETLGHLGRWDEAEAALDAVPATLAQAAIPMRMWVALWSGRVDDIETLKRELDPDSVLEAPALPALADAAQGNWAAGAEVFAMAAESLANDNEYRAYYALMGAAFHRVAGDEAKAVALIKRARELGAGHDWVSVLVRSMAGEDEREPVGDNITEIAEAGRVCEQRFYRAFQTDLSPARRQALLESCVSTGVVDFVEYTASLLRLRELEPERWDPSFAAPDVADPAEDEETKDADREWTRDASPTWSVPS